MASVAFLVDRILVPFTAVSDCQEKKECCRGGVLGIIALAGLTVAAIHYWLIAVPVLVVALAIGIPIRERAVRTPAGSAGHGGS